MAISNSIAGVMQSAAVSRSPSLTGLLFSDADIAADSRAANQNLIFLMAASSFLGFFYGISALGPAALVLFVAPLLFYILALPRVALSALRYGVVWAFPLFALASTLWSREPTASLRNAMFLLGTTYFSILLARSLAPHRLVAAMFFALLAFMFTNLAVGGREVISYNSQEAMNGISGSKNMFGAFSAFLLISAAAVFADSNSRLPLKMIASGGVAVALPCLILARSAGALVSSGLSVGFLAFFLLLGAAKGEKRSILLSIAVFLAAVLVAFVCYIMFVDPTIYEELLHSFGKSSDLTGRAYLWLRAAEYINERPFFGMGYQAFWRQEYVEAEGLWRYMKSTRFGVHFHNLFYETSVQLGYVGATILFASIGSVLVVVLRAALKFPGPVTAWTISFLMFFVGRAYLEVEFVAPFAVGHLVLPVCYVMAAAVLRDAAQHPARARRLLLPAIVPGRRPK